MVDNSYIPEYGQILYNEAIIYMEDKWKRKLDDHEINLLKEVYNFARYVEFKNNEEPFLLWCRLNEQVLNKIN